MRIVEPIDIIFWLSIEQMKRKYLKFNDYLVVKLRDQDEAEAFLDSALTEFTEDGDAQALMLAMRYLAESQGGITQLCKNTKLNKQNLYKILTGKTVPRFDTMVTIIKGLGYCLASKKKESLK